MSGDAFWISLTPAWEKLGTDGQEHLTLEDVSVLLGGLKPSPIETGEMSAVEKDGEKLVPVEEFLRWIDFDIRRTITIEKSLAFMEAFMEDDSSSTR